MVKNLITGICGFVASHLADYLLEQGEEVYGTMRWTENDQNIKHIKDKIHILPMDLNDLSSCIRVIEEVKPDYIFHLAAQSDPRESFKIPIETIRTNSLGTVNLLEAIRMVRDIDSIKYMESSGSPIRKYFDPVIHVCSSSEVYGLVEEKDVPIKETQKFNPANPYAVGKVGTDVAAEMYFKNYGLKIIRTRMFTHTGPRRVMLSAEVNFAKQIAELEYITYYKEDWDVVIKHGNLNSVRTWADVRDAVRAYYLLVRKCKPGEVYNIGGNTTKTVGEVLDYLISLSPLANNITKEQDPKLLRPYDVTLQIPDCSKFKQETGWEPIYTFEQTMKDILDFWRKRINEQ